jgi:uncharacterized protein YeaO (DUF488 family)
MTGRDVRYKRIYDPAEDADGTRVLVDRVWPRGVRKADAHYDEWVKDVAPSTELRKWYGHDRQKFEEFASNYRDELATEPARQALERLRELSSGGRLTLLTASKDVEHSQAAVLAEMLSEGS